MDPPVFMAKSPTALLTICSTPRKDNDTSAISCQGRERQESIYTFVEAVSYLLNEYATNNVISTATSIIKSFKCPNQTVVQFTKAPKDKAL